MSDDTIKLRSFGATALVINLEPPREVRDSLGQKYVENPGRVIKFNAGRARMPSEWLEDLQKTASWKRGKVRIDDGEYMAMDGPIVVSGSLTATRHVEAPLPGWNEMHQARLAKAIRDGEVKDIDRAIAFEKGHKGRNMILKALYVKAADAIGGPDPEPPAADVISRPAPLPGGEA